MKFCSRLRLPRRKARLRNDAPDCDASCKRLKFCGRSRTPRPAPRQPRPAAHQPRPTEASSPSLLKRRRLRSRSTMPVAVPRPGPGRVHSVPCLPTVSLSWAVAADFTRFHDAHRTVVEPGESVRRWFGSSCRSRPTRPSMMRPVLSHCIPHGAEAHQTQLDAQARLV